MTRDDFSNTDRKFSGNEPCPEKMPCSIEDKLAELDSSLSDKTYRQIKELHLALKRKADDLDRRERQLQSLIVNYELEKRAAELNRVGRSSVDAVERRLERLVRQAGGDGSAIGFANAAESGQQSEAPLAEKGLSELELSLRIVDVHSTRRPGKFKPGPPDSDQNHDRKTSVDCPSPATELQSLPFTHQLIRVDEGSEIHPLQDNQQNDEVNRLQLSAKKLKVKSEVLSAVFIELDQVVRELTRQQVLIDKLSLERDSSAVNEFQTVSHNLQRRFKRLSRQVANSHSATQ